MENKSKAEIVQEVIRQRASLRRFAKKAIEPDDFEAIIEAAMRAPTAGNMMMYSVIVVEDSEKKRILSETCDHQPFIAKAPLVLVFLADLQRWFDYYIYSDVKDYCTYQGIPFTGPDEADLLLASSDALIAAQNAVIAAEARGIGSCYIGDIMENYEIHRELLNLAPWTFPITLLCFGYYPEEEKKPALRDRFDKKYIVFKNEYRHLNAKELAEMFKDRERSFSLKNLYNASNFGQFNYARKTGSKFAAEMARSVKAALKHWRGNLIK